MTPKEKAKELIDKYLFVEIAYYTSMHEVKQCALIAVDEVIEANPIAFDEQDNCIAKQWWQEVKTEIQKL
jgi:hypothetical protein